jgi:hypothetical protein
MCLKLICLNRTKIVKLIAYTFPSQLASLLLTPYVKIITKSDRGGDF